MYPHKVNGVVKFPDQSLFRFFFFGFPIETNFDHTSYWITRLSDFGTLKKKLVNQIYMCKHVIDRDSGPSECPNTSTPDTIKLPAWETAPLCVEEWQLWRRRKVFFFFEKRRTPSAATVLLFLLLLHWDRKATIIRYTVSYIPPSTHLFKNKLERSAGHATSKRPTTSAITKESFIFLMFSSRNAPVNSDRISNM